ncbi:hypothetical protein EDB85DRAFT_590681 [Lactarius pseudohatsudake]|nr:hypothetical protein EDB85DRAFT_590681 [Lactarius pseudohatsudake]
MRSSPFILALAASFSTALAFSGTNPVVAWSSHRSDAVTRPSAVLLSSGSPHWDDVFVQMFGDGLCEFDAVVLVDQPGLHASDLRFLSPESFVATRLQDSPSSSQLPYVRFPHQGNSLQDLADRVTQHCGAQRLSFPVGEGPEDLESDGKHVLSLSMPEITENAGARRDFVAEHEARLASELERIERTFPRHVVVFAGSRRQDDSAPEPAPSHPAGGILARYQLLTPALISALLLTFFVLIPIVLFGVSALASIQSPLHVNAPKGYSADEKKNQ